MANNFRQNNAPKMKCNKCNSENIKKRKNFSHGSGSSARVNYFCGECGSSDIFKPQQRRGFRR